MSAAPLFLILLAAALGLTIFSWTLWRPGDAKWRNTVGLVGLVGASLQLLVLLLFECYGFAARGFSDRVNTFFVWGRIDFYLSVLTLLATLIGKGRFRIPVVLSLLTVEVLWFALGMGL